MQTSVLRPRLDTETARLVVRPWKNRDFNAWRTAGIEQPPPTSVHDDGGRRPEAELTRPVFQSMIKRNTRLLRADKGYHFGLFDRTQTTLFGVISLQVVARFIVQTAWIGWRIYGQHRRKGYAKEGVTAVIDIAFRQLQLHRLEAGIEPDNHISTRLARSLRMRKEGSFKKNLFLRGQWVDLDVYATHSEDWGLQSVPSFGVTLGDRLRIEPRER